MPVTLEICAGAGGQALGLEQAGFEHAALVEIDEHCCATLRANRPRWNIYGGDVQGDVAKFDGSSFRGEIDLLAGGIPCPPFSVAGRKLGEADERNLFPEVIRLADEIRPRAIMIENVPGLLSVDFEYYRESIISTLSKLGYKAFWEKLNASDFGVPQLRPRAVLVALQKDIANYFSWPKPSSIQPPTVGETLKDLMEANGWKGAKEWAEKANKIGPTIVGGSMKHGGPDLGPSWAKKAWANLNVNGLLIGNDAPLPDFVGMPHLTVRMVARLQGFPDSWQFVGKKTNTYRQVGNAFPPPVAHAVGTQLFYVLTMPQLIQVAL